MFVQTMSCLLWCLLGEACRCAKLVASLLSLLARICQDWEDHWATYSAFGWEFFVDLVSCCLAVVPVQLLLFTCAEYRATIRVRVIHLKWAAPRAFVFQSVPYAMMTPGSLYSWSQARISRKALRSPKSNCSNMCGLVFLSFVSCSPTANCSWRILQQVYEVVRVRVTVILLLLTVQVKSIRLKCWFAKNTQNEPKWQTCWEDSPLDEAEAEDSPLQAAELEFSFLPSRYAVLRPEEGQTGKKQKLKAGCCGRVAQKGVQFLNLSQRCSFGFSCSGSVSIQEIADDISGQVSPFLLSCKKTLRGMLDGTVFKQQALRGGCTT